MVNKKAIELLDLEYFKQTNFGYQLSKFDQYFEDMTNKLFLYI